MFFCYYPPLLERKIFAISFMCSQAITKLPEGRGVQIRKEIQRERHYIFLKGQIAQQPTDALCGKGHGRQYPEAMDGSVT